MIFRLSIVTVRSDPLIRNPAANTGSESGFLVISSILLAIVCREILVSGLREFLAEIRVGVPVSRLAKWKTAVQMAAMANAVKKELVQSKIAWVLRNIAEMAAVAEGGSEGARGRWREMRGHDGASMGPKMF